MKKAWLIIFLLLPFLFAVASANTTTLTVATRRLDAIVSVSNVADLYGYEFKLVFDSAIVKIESIEFTGLNEPSKIFYYNLGENYVHVAVCSLYPNVEGVSGDIVLAIIHFNSQTDGTSLLQFEFSILADSNGNAIVHQAFNGIITTDSNFIYQKATDAETKRAIFMP